MNDSSQTEGAAAPTGLPDAAALGEVPHEVRVNERQRLEALAKALYPAGSTAIPAAEAAAPASFWAALPRWFWWLLVAGLGLGLASRSDRPGVNPTAIPGRPVGILSGASPALASASPAPSIGGQAGSAPVGEGNTPAGRRAAAERPLSPNVDSVLVAADATPAGPVAGGPQVAGTVVGPPVAGPTPGNAAGWPCPDVAGDPDLIVPDEPGPWVLGRVMSAGCRPVVGAVVALSASGGLEYLARTEIDGSFALAAEPGVYRAELVEASGLAWLDGRAQAEAGRVELTLPEATSLARLLFLVPGGAP
jgi:hypothetical protein